MPTAKKSPVKSTRKKPVKKHDKKAKAKKEKKQPGRKKDKQTKLQRDTARVFAAAIKNNEPMTKGQAIIEAGGAEGTARTPSKIFDRLGFKEELADLLPPKELAAALVGQTGCYSTRTLEFPLALKPEDIIAALSKIGFLVLTIRPGMMKHYVIAGVPDNMAINKTLETVLKVYNLIGKDNDDDDPDDDKPNKTILALQQIALNAKEINISLNAKDKSKKSSGKGKK